MPMFLQRDLERLKKLALEMGTLVEENIARAVTALNTCDRSLAEEIVASDAQVDRREVEIEEECLKILALHQPVARDLRFVVTVLKMNNDLERMGDYSVNIAQRVLFFAARGRVPVPESISVMAGKVAVMVRRSLDSLVEADSKLARSVILSDDDVDQMRDDIFGVTIQEMRSDPQRIELWIQIMSTARYLERIADLATNLAQDVIYLVEGEVVRHKPPADYPAGSLPDADQPQRNGCRE